MVLTEMEKALYDALYVYQRPFVWVHFTKHGAVCGRLSRTPADAFFAADYRNW